MESTQDRILTAARELFGKQGFRGTTTLEIARAAGIAEGTIFRYYRDKKELLVACVQPAIEEIIRRERAAACIQAGSPREILHRRMVERVRVVREHLGIFNILFTEGKHIAEIAQILMSHVSQSVTADEWQALVELQKRGPSQRPFNPMIMSIGIMSAIWAMVSLEPNTEQLFAAWPVKAAPDQLESDFAEFVCSALYGPGQAVTEG